MAFSDPLSVTINAVAQPLPRLGVGNNTAYYQKDDATVKLTASHTYAKRTRRVIRLDFNKIAADPLAPALNAKSSMAAYLVIDQPTSGFSNTEIKYVVDALTAALNASSGALLVKFIAGES